MATTVEQELEVFARVNVLLGSPRACAEKILKENRDVDAIYKLAERYRGKLRAGTSLDAFEIAGLVPLLYRIGEPPIALKLANEWLSSETPELYGRINEEVDRASAGGDAANAARHLSGWLDDCLTREVAYEVRERKSPFSILRNTVKRLGETQCKWGAVQDSIRSETDLLACQIIAQSSHESAPPVPREESARLDQLEEKLGAAGYCVEKSKRFDRSPSLMATRRYTGTFQRNIQAEVQLWIRGYFYPMYSYWYFRWKGFAFDFDSDLTGEEARKRVRGFRDLELGGCKRDLSIALFQELRQRLGLDD